MTMPTTITRDWILAICEQDRCDEDVALETILAEIDKEAESEAARAFYCFPTTAERKARRSRLTARKASLRKTKRGY